ncbi:MAG: hypothetical protein JXQ84_03615 [Rhodospirillaceae bacterium]|nr:hypothetical protein [Rhodospirillaceae bacterium]
MPDGRQAADDILGRLLSRLEVKPERSNRLIERVPACSFLYEEMEAFRARIEEAVACGAVTAEMGRNECRHLVERVILADPRRLYELLDRRPRALTAREAAAAVRAKLPPTDFARVGQVLADLEADWCVGRSLGLGIGPDEPDVVSRCFKSAAALANGTLGEIDLRTFSRRVTGDSKFVEKNMGRVVGVLRHLMDIPDEFAPEEALASLGVVRFPQPCLISGPVSYRGMLLPTDPYIGVSPEMVSELAAVGSPPWILTIENLASFNRQVREARGAGIVVYTGGFPSPAVVACVKKLAVSCSCPVFHWGDIDGGGVRIARCLEVALMPVGRKLGLHLMAPELAISRGENITPIEIFRIDMSQSVVGGLVRFLASPAACTLEQEEMDPTLPMETAI